MGRKEEWKGRKGRKEEWKEKKGKSEGLEGRGERKGEKKRGKRILIRTRRKEE